MKLIKGDVFTEGSLVRQFPIEIEASVEKLSLAEIAP